MNRILFTLYSILIIPPLHYLTPLPREPLLSEVEICCSTVCFVAILRCGPTSSRLEGRRIEQRRSPSHPSPRFLFNSVATRSSNRSFPLKYSPLLPSYCWGNCGRLLRLILSYRRAEVRLCPSLHQFLQWTTLSGSGGETVRRGFNQVYRIAPSRSIRGEW